MDFSKLVKKRHTCFEFSKKKVSDSKIKKILDAGILSPSSNNSQPWKFIVIKNKETINKLMENCTYGFFHTEPYAVIAIVLEPIYEEQKGLLRKGVKEMALSHKFMNVGFAGSIITFQAEDLGLNTAILSPDVKKVNKILNVEKGKEVHLMIAIGYEEKKAYRPEQSRKHEKEVVVNEKYS